MRTPVCNALPGGASYAAESMLAACNWPIGSEGECLLEIILGPIDIKQLQMAFEKLGWMPPDTEAIIACLCGGRGRKGGVLDLDAALRKAWVEKLRSAENFDRKGQEAVYSSLRSDIGEWLDHYTRGEDRPK